MPFSALGLPEPVTRGVRAAGYTQPTPIQREAIPLILPGHDLVASAQTGSGKTAAFLLPILARLLTGPRALRALVLVPTRELAAQVETNGKEYARFADVSVGAVFGGVPIGPQEKMLRRDGVDLLVATPGRLLDLHGRQSVSLEDIEVLVLDEADRMVDMGFAPDLRRILKLLPRERQTLMFSATMPSELNAVANEALRHPKRLALAPPARPAERIDQAFYPVSRALKVDLLDRILSMGDLTSAIVFVRTKRGADRMGKQLKRRGHSVGVLHGDRSQGQRERALEDFRSGRVDILVATDIASRGIDVDDITHVINYDVPRTPEDYVHRIGRTGRMNAGGDAITLITPDEKKEVAAIEKALGHPVRRMKLEKFDYDKRPEKEPVSHEHHEHHDQHERHGRRGRSHATVQAAAVAAAPQFGRTPRADRPGQKKRRRF
jgi:ATP-dependent RNA helicase RhlE